MNTMPEGLMSLTSNFAAALDAYRRHLSEQWLQPHALERVIDQRLKSDFLAAREALSQDNDETSVGLIETGDYLIDCYETLVAGKAVAGLAEAEGGYNYYLRESREKSPTGLRI